MCIYIYIYIIETHTQYHTHFFIWGLSFGHRCKHCEEEDWELHRKKTGAWYLQLSFRKRMLTMQSMVERWHEWGCGCILKLPFQVHPTSDSSLGLQPAFKHPGQIKIAKGRQGGSNYSSGSLDDSCYYYSRWTKYSNPCINNCRQPLTPKGQC